MENTDNKPLNEKEIAVVGVSDKPEKYGYKIFKSLMESGYKVEGINVRGGEVLGKKIYKNLQELKKIPELVITVVPPQVTENVVEECRKLGIKEIWMQPGSESENALKKAKEYGIKTTHNACLMIFNGIW
jgi:uncharacterized protein